MNRQQACVHIASNAADRLSEILSPDLALEVRDVLADADRALSDAELGDEDSGYDVPPQQDAASLVAACAIHGAQAVWEQDFGKQPRAHRSASEWFEAVRTVLDEHTRQPPVLDRQSYEQVLDVVSQEVVGTFERRDVP